MWGTHQGEAMNMIGPRRSDRMEGVGQVEDRDGGALAGEYSDTPKKTKRTSRITSGSLIKLRPVAYST